MGDTLFAPDYGTARCDFPGGSAAELYDSIQRFYAPPGATAEAPAIILPSLQVNIRGGDLPAAKANGIRYLEIPLNVLGSAR